MCGGQFTVSYYDTNTQLDSPPTAIQLTNHTDTSLALRWTAPERHDPQRGQYIIQATIVHSFDPNQRPPPEWIVSEPHIDIPNLHPGTAYNVTIISASENGRRGGRRSLVAQTDIGRPEPAPQQPKVISETETTRVIEIRPSQNRNGPVSWYRVLVVLIDSGEFVQSINEELATNYRQSRIDETNFYIAAELEVGDVVRRFTVGDGRTYRGYENPPLKPDKHVHFSVGLVSQQDGLTLVRYSARTHEQHDHHGDDEQPDVVMVADDMERE